MGSGLGLEADLLAFVLLVVMVLAWLGVGAG